jgi:diguanylate cyclase (GGDEF)-like protein
MSERVQELERLALIDPMTQLSNRRHLESELGGLFKQQKRLGITFGLLFIDIDHFKDVNDTFGHDTGDLVLKMVARTLTSAVREFDNVGRWGGEEFVILARANTEGELFGLAERLRHLVSQSFLSHMERRIHVTSPSEPPWPDMGTPCPRCSGVRTISSTGASRRGGTGPRAPDGAVRGYSTLICNVEKKNGSQAKSLRAPCHWLGGPPRNRTLNLRIKSPLLCQLS